MFNYFFIINLEAASPSIPPGCDVATPFALPSAMQQTQTLVNKPFLEMIFNTLQCSENDYAALFALCLLYALGHNEGMTHN